MPTFTARPGCQPPLMVILTLLAVRPGNNRWRVKAVLKASERLLGTVRVLSTVIVCTYNSGRGAVPAVATALKHQAISNLGKSSGAQAMSSSAREAVRSRSPEGRGTDMTLDAADTVRAALDDGCSLAELELTLLARADTGDQIAAAWLYAQAYDSIRPRHDSLHTQITSLTCRLPPAGRRLAHRPGHRHKPYRQSQTASLRPVNVNW